jgi:ribosome maturation factor RimP
VAIDREGGIGSDEITGFSESLSRELDAMGAVPGDTRYILEVTTPGAERKLRTPEQFATCRGRQARLTFRDGRPPLEGVIADADETSVRVEGEGGPVVVAFDEVSQARLNAPGV